MNVKQATLKVLDEIEEMRRNDPGNDYEYRVVAANVAEKYFEDRVDWTEELKKDKASKYHKWYFEEYYNITKRA